MFIVSRKSPASAFSWSLGDALAKMVVVSPDAETPTHELTRDDICMIIATDGVWEFVGNAEAVQIVKKHKEAPQKTANQLVRMSLDRWLEAQKSGPTISQPSSSSWTPLAGNLL